MPPLPEWSLLLVGAVFAALVIVLPLVRAWWRTGELAFVGHRSSDNLLHQVTGLGFGALLLAGLGYCVAYSTLGAEAFFGQAPHGLLSGIGLALMLLATGLIALAQAQMGRSWRIGIDSRPTSIVDQGLYGWVRHPIYSGVLLWLAGASLFAPTPPLMLGVALLVFVLAVQARLEEQHMLSVHGEDYAVRARSIGRFMPWLGTDLEALPAPLWLLLSLALGTVALLDLMQIVWLPWIPKSSGALLGSLLYATLALGAFRGKRWAAVVPMVIPLLPVSILLLTALGVSLRVRPDVPMVVILFFQLAGAGLGACLTFVFPRHPR